MGFKSDANFWVLSPPLLSDKKLAEWDYASNEQIWTERECPASKDHVSSRRTAELRVKLRGGKQDDIVWTHFGECLVQESVVNFIQEQGFTGFEIRGAQTSYKSKKFDSPPRLWELETLGSGGMLLPEERFLLVSHCDICGKEEFKCLGEGVEVNPEIWDGSDFFRAWPLPTRVFITDRVAKGLLLQSFSGFSLECPEKISLSSTLSPGSVCSWAPQ